MAVYEFELDWQTDARCLSSERVQPNDFFFEGDGRFKRGSRAFNEHVKLLRSICNSCPVRRQCDAYADQTGGEGFWAGLTEDERKQRRKMRTQTGVQIVALPA